MVKWEYRVLVFKSAWGAQMKQQHEEELNALGQEGWELAGMAAEGAATSLVFKRPVVSHPQPRQHDKSWPSW